MACLFILFVLRSIQMLPGHFFSDYHAGHLDICMLVLFDKYTWHAHIAKSYTTPIDHSYVKLEQFVALLFFWCCG
jgi:hypothetical protein